MEPRGLHVVIVVVWAIAAGALTAFVVVKLDEPVTVDVVRNHTTTDIVGTVTSTHTESFDSKVVLSGPLGTRVDAGAGDDQGAAGAAAPVPEATTQTATTSAAGAAPPAGSAETTGAPAGAGGTETNTTAGGASEAGATSPLAGVPTTGADDGLMVSLLAFMVLIGLGLLLAVRRQCCPEPAQSSTAPEEAIAALEFALQAQAAADRSEEELTRSRAGAKAAVETAARLATAGEARLAAMYTSRAGEAALKVAADLGTAAKDREQRAVVKRLETASGLAIGRAGNADASARNSSDAKEIARLARLAADTARTVADACASALLNLTRQPSAPTGAPSPPEGDGGPDGGSDDPGPDPGNEPGGTVAPSSPVLDK